LKANFTLNYNFLKNLITAPARAQNKNKMSEYRIYNTESFDYETPNYLTVIAESELIDTTNSYGMYVKNSDYVLDDSDFFKNADGIYYSIYESALEEIPDFISEMAEAWDFRKLTAAQMQNLIDASEYDIDNSDEADYREVYDIEFKSESGFIIEETQPYAVGKHIQYWDGNNFRTVQIEHDFYETAFTDVTDEYEDFENW